MASIKEALVALLFQIVNHASHELKELGASVEPGRIYRYLVWYSRTKSLFGVKRINPLFLGEASIPDVAKFQGYPLGVFHSWMYLSITE